MRAVAAALVVTLAGAVPAAAEPAAGDGSTRPALPLQVRNLSPVTRLFGLPRALGGIPEPGRLEASLQVEHANNFAADVDEDVAVLFDGSTTVTSLALRRRLGTRWEWGMELPYVHHGGGFTDGFIEGYHELLGLPDGDRDGVSRDRIDYRVVYRGEEVISVTGADGSLGDARLWLGYRVHAGPGREAVVRGMLELPTGEAADLSGSGSTEGALWLELVDGRWLAALNVTMTLAAGVTFPGESELGLPQRDLAGSAHLGLHYPLSGRVTLRAQLDGHTAVIDVESTPLGAGALLGSLGGSVRLTPALALDLALVEDLTPDRAPDVVFLTSLRARF